MARKRSAYDREKLAFIKFWNSTPSEEAFTARMCYEAVHAYQLYYMVKYPNGGIPLPKGRK